MIYLVLFLLILMSAIFSGLTLGLLGLNKSDLETKIKAGNKEAKIVYSVRRNGNLLLSTLLVGNVAVNSVVAIILGDIASGVIAGLVSTGLIVIFGEIIPQAVFSRFPLKFGSKLTWLVKIIMVILLPVCYPIAFALDKILGEEVPTIWKKDELIEIIRLHRNSPHSSIDSDEKRIVTGALTFSSKDVTDVMTPRNVVFWLNVKDQLSRKMVSRMTKSGFTRIPVFNDKNDKPVGILYVKDLVCLELGKKVRDVFRKEKLLFIRQGKKLDWALNELIKKKKHMAFVVDKYGTFLGIVTLEDIIEEVLDKEIVDETDVYRDLQKKAEMQRRRKRKKITSKKT